MPTQDIKAVRTRLGETQAAFASRFGVDQTTIHRWETDGVPDRAFVRAAVEQVLQGLPAEAINEPGAAQ